jgi:hypothetical protein
MGRPILGAVRTHSRHTASANPTGFFKRWFPDQFFQQPTARPSRALPSGRPRCEANGVCHTCPIDSKFTIHNELAHLFEDPRVTLCTGANVKRLDVAGNTVRGVHYRHAGIDRIARADIVGLGANAIFNPALLLRSGVTDGGVGRGLGEQVSLHVDVMLKGVNSFQGSTSITGLGYMLYGGEHRRERAGALMEVSNVPVLRTERGRWRERVVLKFIYEDLPRPDNQVTIDLPTRSGPLSSSRDAPSTPSAGWLRSSRTCQGSSARFRSNATRSRSGRARANRTSCARRRWAETLRTASSTMASCTTGFGISSSWAAACFRPRRPRIPH